MVTFEPDSQWIIFYNTKFETMPVNTDPKQVQDELARKNTNSSTKKLTFDPISGELILKSPMDTENRPNEVVVDQIYKDGFFTYL
jgi:hypothetical protein